MMKHLKSNDANSSLDRQRLAQELGVTAVPAAVERKLRQIYAELPGEVPQSYLPPKNAPAMPGLPYTQRTEEVVAVEARRLPWPARWALTTAAALALVCGLLLGANQVAPSFTESLPGLGGLFSTMNGAKNPMGVNLDSYVDAVKDIDLMALAKVDSGYSLRVDQSFCDGKNVYLTLELTCPEEASKYNSITPYQHTWEAGGTDYEYTADDTKFLIDGKEVTPVSGGSSGPAQEGKISYSYTLPLPGEYENGKELPMSLHVPDLVCFFDNPNQEGGQSHETIPVGFDAEFTITVDTSYNRITVGEGDDNGVSIQRVESTPSYIAITLEAPVWGYEGEESLHTGIPLGIPNNCYLYTEDGQKLERVSNLWDLDDRVENVEGPVPVFPPKGEMLTHTIGFAGAPEGCQKVVLRILNKNMFEYEWQLENGSEAVEELARLKPGVFAELTIDLETGKATATDTYTQFGFEKLDSEEYINTPHTPNYTGGYYVQNQYIGPAYDDETGEPLSGWSYEVDLYADVAEPDIEVRLLSQGEQVGVIQCRPVEECEPVHNGEWYQYKDGSGVFTRDSCEDVLDPEGYRAMGWQTIPQWALRFRFDGLDSPAGSNNDLYEALSIQVVDSKTGEVLIDDPLISDVWRP